MFDMKCDEDLGGGMIGEEESPALDRMKAKPMPEIDGHSTAWIQS